MSKHGHFCTRRGFIKSSALMAEGASLLGAGLELVEANESAPAPVLTGLAKVALARCRGDGAELTRIEVLGLTVDQARFRFDS